MMKERAAADVVRLELEDVRREIAALQQREARLLGWLREGEALGIIEPAAESGPIAKTQYEWARLVLLRKGEESMRMPDLVAAIVAMGGPKYNGTSLSSILSKKRKLGLTENVGMAWRLTDKGRESG